VRRHQLFNAEKNGCVSSKTVESVEVKAYRARRDSCDHGSGFLWKSMCIYSNKQINNPVIMDYIQTDPHVLRVRLIVEASKAKDADTRHHHEQVSGAPRRSVARSRGLQQAMEALRRWSRLGALLSASNRSFPWRNSEEMDTALMTFVNALGAVIMVSLVGFHYLTAKPSDADM
jgi:hypothetical protein